ncbi:hypothetical protein GQX74_013623 [Glossina fuscipes]|nr:hypothetical protein GQX74_013623 [Glossina fuscipes]
MFRSGVGLVALGINQKTVYRWTCLEKQNDDEILADGYGLQFCSACSIPRYFQIDWVQNNIILCTFIRMTISKRWIPPRWNELLGLQHMKIYLFDDAVLISGANLSNDYFTNRQDRYILIEGKALLISMQANSAYIALHQQTLGCDDMLFKEFIL